MTDYGFLKMMNLFEEDGYQIELRGKYYPIKTKKNQMLLTVGENLQKVSNNFIKARRYRQTEPGTDRYMCTFSLNPKFSARIPEKMLYTARRQCEDLMYEKDPNHREEFIEVTSEAALHLKRLRNEFGDWYGFTIPDPFFEYGSRL